MNIGIIGSGSWARALATLVAEAGHRPRIGYKKKPLIGFPGSPNIAAITKESDLLFIAVGLGRFRTIVQEAMLGPTNQVVIAARGLEPKTGNWLSSIIVNESAAYRTCALAGPALPEEILHRRPTAMVAASPFIEVQKNVQRALHSSICRLYTSSDLLGVELAGAMVRALTIALGIADGLNQGVGVRGVIVTRGLHEASRLGTKLGAKEQTLFGLAGLGDLISCGSLPSHHGYAAGRALGAGKSISPALVSELQSILQLAQRNQVELPLTEAVTAIALGKIRPRLAIDMLMRRKASQE